MLVLVSGSSSTSWREAWAREVVFASFLNDSQAGENQVRLHVQYVTNDGCVRVNVDEGSGGQRFDGGWLEYIGHEIIDGLSKKY